MEYKCTYCLKVFHSKATLDIHLMTKRHDWRLKKAIEMMERGDKDTEGCTTIKNGNLNCVLLAFISLTLPSQNIIDKILFPINENLKADHSNQRSNLFYYTLDEIWPCSNKRLSIYKKRMDYFVPMVCLGSPSNVKLLRISVLSLPSRTSKKEGV